MILYKRYRSFGVVCCLCLLFILAGCEEEAAPPPAAVKSSAVKKKVTTADKEEKIEKEVEDKIKFVYDPSGKRDPFLPFLASLMVDSDSESVPVELLTELQKFELSQLKLVAVMDIGGKGVAQVETPDGIGHTVYVGTLMGKHKGKVVEIKDGKVYVEEKFRDILGDIKSTVNELVIEHPDGGLVL